MMPTILKKYQALGQLLSAHFFQSGTFLNYEGTAARDGTPTGVILNRNGANLKTTTNKIDCGADYLGTTALTVIAKVRNDTFGGSEVGRIVSNGKFFFGAFLVNSRYYVYNDGATVKFSANSAVVLGSRTIVAVTTTVAGLANIYVNGVLSGTANETAGAPVGGTTNTTIGNNSGGSVQLNGSISWIVCFNTVLTQSQINEVSAAIDGIIWPTKPFSRANADLKVNQDESGLIFAPSSKIVNNTLIDSSSRGNNSTLLGGLTQKNSPMGNVLSFDGVNDYAQSGLTTNEAYTNFSVVAWVKTNNSISSGQTILSKYTNAPYPLVFGFTTGVRLWLKINDVDYSQNAGAVLVNNQWQQVGFSLDTTLGSDNVKFYINGELVDTSNCTDPIGANTNGWYIGSRVGSFLYPSGEMIPPKVYNRTLSAAEFKNDYNKAKQNQTSYSTDWGTNVTVSNLTAGEIAGFKISSGSWAVVTSSINGKTVKALKCITAGIAYIPTSYFQETATEAAYGEREWWIYKGAEANNVFIGFTADTIGGYTATGQDAYWLHIDNDERIYIRESINGSQASLMYTATGTFPVATWAKVNVPRTSAGAITTKLNNTAVTATFGTNPITDTTITTGTYEIFDFDANDQISLGAVDGSYAFTKRLLS